MTEIALRNFNGAYSVQDVIDWFLSKDSMSPKKLQKILYYAYSWTLTLQNDDVDDLDNRLFDETFEAWVHGPVIPSVYFEYRGNGYQEIKKTDRIIRFDEDTEDILNQVWSVYGEYNGNQLELLTHKEAPWLNAREGYKPLDICKNSIDDRDIFKCYGERL